MTRCNETSEASALRPVPTSQTAGNRPMILVTADAFIAEAALSPSRRGRDLTEHAMYLCNYTFASEQAQITRYTSSITVREHSMARNRRILACAVLPHMCAIHAPRHSCLVHMPCTHTLMLGKISRAFKIGLRCGSATSAEPPTQFSSSDTASQLKHQHAMHTLYFNRSQKTNRSHLRKTNMAIL